MGKVYGKNASDSTQLIIDGDAIDQRLSTLEANWNSISHKIVSVNETIASQGQVFVTLENVEGYTCVSCMLDGTSTNSLAFSLSAPMRNPNSGLTYTRIINMMSSQITVKGTITAVYMRI